MTGLFLTKNATPILSQFAAILGWIINGIFNFLDSVGMSQCRTDRCYFYSYYLYADASAYLQAAEVFPHVCEDESGASGDSEKI